MTDLAAAHRLLDQDAWQTEKTLAEREAWLSWTVANYGALADLWQPPYGDRAVELVATGELVGSVGIVPSMGPWAQLNDIADGRLSPEVGLFWATAAAHRGQGIATEAAGLVIRHLFDHWNLRRVVATTEHDNPASQAVMRKLGMTVQINTFPTPPWFQVVGVISSEVVKW